MTTLIMTAETVGLKRLAAWLKNLDAKRIERAKIRNTIKELSALDDRALWDMGMTRGDIYSVANGTSDLVRSQPDENTNLKGWV